MHHIMIFLDGIGLGANDSTSNPFAVINAPTLHSLSSGRRWLASTPRTESERAIFIPTDAGFGVEGRPQSATGHAAILTGRNVPAEIGKHYGPKPTPDIRAILDEANLFKTLVAHGHSATLITPYPPPFFAAIERGKRLPSGIQHAVMSADIPLLTEVDYYAGNAIAPDFTGAGWTSFLGYHDAPTYTPRAAGRRLAELARERTLTFFSTWITDEIGHRGPLERGVEFLETFDGFMAGLLAAWHDEDGLILVFSDHGNLEVQGDRRHSENQVPTVVIGAQRHAFAQGYASLLDITPNFLRTLGINSATLP
jgi:2,3-bisphosphoglycerate-independent phosphoglycerate mutase